MNRFRTEIIGDATLILGDCREILPTLGKVDAVVTDPPYGIGKDGQKRTTGGNGGRKEYAFLGWDGERPSRELFDALRNLSITQIFWGGNYFADMLPASSKWLVWDKGQRINQSDVELAYTSLPGALRIFEQNRVALLIEGASHPTQKPIELMTWSLQQLPEKAKTILDPFMGSGTTGVSCMKLGLRFVGIEREPTYFDIACRRIEEAWKQPRLFDEPKPKDEQLSLMPSDQTETSARSTVSTKTTSSARRRKAPSQSKQNT